MGLGVPTPYIYETLLDIDVEYIRERRRKKKRGKKINPHTLLEKEVQGREEERRKKKREKTLLACVTLVTTH